MKSQILSIALAALAAAAPLEVEPRSPEQGCTYPIGQHGSDFAKVSGQLFEIDGKVEYFAGTNAWWLAHLNNNSDIDLSLSEMAQTQYKIVRVWGFGDTNTVPPDNAPFGTYFQVLNSSGSYINYGADGLQRLDYTVHAAEKYNVKLVLPFVNNWGDMGGIGAYTAAFGGNSTSWYTDAKSQAAYKKYIKVIVNRYKKSNAIFAWELGNEPRCKGCATSVIYKWATGISEYIKSLDPDHMVALGDEGWLSPATFNGDGSYAYSGAEGVDFVKNLDIKTLDYGTFHCYPNSWGYDYPWGSQWITEHDGIGAAAKKPIIFEEYGTPFPHNHTATESPWQAVVLKSGIAADQIWQFGPSAKISVSLDSLQDVNTIFYDDAEYQILGKDHAAKMLAKKVPGH